MKRQILSISIILISVLCVCAQFDYTEFLNDARNYLKDANAESARKSYDAYVKLSGVEVPSLNDSITFIETIDPEKAFELAKKYYKDGRRESIKWFKRAADLGSTDAMVEYAFFSDEEAERKEWMLKAANLGNPHAQNFMGSYTYLHGDYNAALDWYKKAADQGNGYALFEVGKMYYNGYGVQLDRIKTLEYFLKVKKIDANYPLFDKHYGENGERDRAFDLDYYFGNIYNDEDVLNFCIKCAEAINPEHPDPEAQYNLGKHFMDLGMQNPDLQDNYKSEGAEWIKKAAENGYAKAQYELGNMYLDVPKYERKGKKWEEQEKEGCYWITEAASNGYAPNPELLGLMYYNGKGVSKDVSKALDYFDKYLETLSNESNWKDTESFEILDKEFKKHKNNKAGYIIAKRYYKDKDFKSGYEYAKPYAINDANPDAQAMVGVILFSNVLESSNGTEAPSVFNNIRAAFEAAENTSSDDTEALSLLNNAAVQGNVEAQMALSEIYLNRNKYKDLDKAFKYCKLAAEQGNKTAQLNLAYMYATGQGTEKNIDTALDWYVKGKEDNKIVIFNNKTIGMDWTGYTFPSASGIVVKKDQGSSVTLSPAQAKYLYEAFAEKGNFEAMYGLGVYYRDDEKNTIEAKKWFTKAAEGGDARAQNNLACLYGSEGNYNEAFKWFKKSAENKNKYGEYNLANYYYNGKGTNKNYAEAFKWYKKSAEAGYADAQYQLAKRYESGEGTEKNIKEALKWYEKAKENGYKSSYLDSKISELKSKIE